ncbi:MAG TPA: OmpH family outer membrane protein [bacterium]|nr:OmpH family outer membrane protein [bacterium]
MRLRGVLLALGAVLLMSGCGGAVGVVDSQRVLNESVKALQYQRQLDDREKQMAAELAALAPQVSRAELSARRARLLTELGQMRRDLEVQLNQDLYQVAGRVAREDRLRIVLVKAPTLRGGRDITQQVIDQLK